MEYQALYRKYRPQRFADIIGQSHVTETLAREVQENRVAHAYLLAGPRGTGKTTTARILAKALNCTNLGENGEPCNTCNSCVAVTEGSSLDVIELDAASHNSVDDIRDIRVSVTTVASVGGAKRIFILDEAHMLSKAAGNALLKTLEEPPPHVHFVLATTEPYKLLDTIRSRSQRFDFHNVAVELLAGYLTRISSEEEYEVEPAALTAVARHARGSVRDALSLLEQVAALGDGSVEVRGVNRALGLADSEVYAQLARAVVRQDARAAIEMVASLSAEGVDLRRFVSEGIAFFRGVFLAHYAPNLAEVADDSADVLEEWVRVSKELPAPDVLRTVDHLAEALLRLREGREERLMVEITLLKLTRPETAGDLASMAARLEHVEQRVRRLGAGVPAVVKPATSVGGDAAAGEVGAAKPATRPAASAAAEGQSQTGLSDGPWPSDEQNIPDEPPPSEPAELETSEPQSDVPGMALIGDLTLGQFESVWPALVAGVRDDLGPRRQALFREASPGSVQGLTVTLLLPDHLSFHLEQLQSDDLVKEVVEAHAAELLGGSIQIQFRSGSQSDEGVSVSSDEMETLPDKHELLEAPSGPTDPDALVEGLLGGQVVEEIVDEN
ncbi:MAG: DNA polymerase III subunit gamma/tau [Acidimicrobiia bacterium]|nr:DNA polymerase III subunit gamma/tau [Acidimicrobiia bacterium]